MAWQFGSRMQRMGFGSFCGMMVGRIIGDIKDEILKTSLARGRKKEERKEEERNQKTRTDITI